jgi:hypothetical protein
MSSAILIVDDGTNWARNVTRYLQRHGFGVLAKERPALLCLDLRLPSPRPLAREAAR